MGLLMGVVGNENAREGTPEKIAADVTKGLRAGDTAAVQRGLSVMRQFYPHLAQIGPPAPSAPGETPPETFLNQAGTAARDVLRLPGAVTREVGHTLENVPVAGAVSGYVGEGLNAAGNIAKKVANAPALIPGEEKLAGKVGQKISDELDKNPRLKNALTSIFNIGNLAITAVAGWKAPFAVEVGENVSGAALQGIGAASKKVASDLMQSGMKIKDKTAIKAGRNSLDGTENIINNIEKYKVEAPFRQIPDKAQAVMDAAKSAGDQVIEKSMAEFPDKKVKLEDVVTKFYDDATEGKIRGIAVEDQDKAANLAIDLYDTYAKKLKIPAEASIAQANEMKKRLGEKVFKQGSFQIVSDPLKDQVKEILDLRIRDAIREQVPELDKYNRTIHDLIPVKQAAQEAVKRLGNRDKITLADWAFLVGGGEALKSLGVLVPAAPAVGASLLVRKAMSGGVGSSALMKSGRAVENLGKTIKSLPRTKRLSDLNQGE
jgi:hypothetical protein